MRLPTVVFLMLLACATPLVAQSTPSPSTPQATPYTEEEFEPWVLQLRRAEIIAVGAFPLTYLLAGLGYDYVYYLTNGFPSANVPWPVGPGTSRWVAPAQAQQIEQKNLTLVGVSLAAGVLLAAVDWWLGQ